MTSDDGVLPLINVVFLLLVFFMVAGRLSEGDPFAVRPVRSAVEGPAPQGEGLLLIAADGRLAWRGVEMPRETLLAAVAEEAPPRMRVKADGNADALAVVALLAALRERGVGEARLMTEPVR